MTEQLLAVNTMAPMALVRAALPRIDRGGGVAVITAILADYPTAGIAAYSGEQGGDLGVAHRAAPRAAQAAA